MSIKSDQSAMDRFRAEVDIGLEQARWGELIDFTPELLQQLSQKAEENARRGKPIKEAVKPEGAIKS